MQNYTPFDPLSLNFGDFTKMASPGMVDGLAPTNTGFGGFGATPPQSFLQRTGLGMNMPTFGLALGGIQTLGGLWGAYNAAKVAKQQLAFTKATTNANLANQTQSYNTSIADRARSRGITEGQSASQIEDYISRNSLAKRTIG